MQEITTISNLFQLKQIIADHGLQTYIIDDVTDGNSGFTIDLGIFANAQTIRLPPPIRGNANTKYNRWLAISEELQTLNDSNLQKDNETGISIYFNQSYFFMFLFFLCVLLAFEYRWRQRR